MHLQQLLVKYKSLADLLEKIDEMGGAYDFLPEGYFITIDDKRIYPAFQYEPNANVQAAIKVIANHYALLGDLSGLGLFSCLLVNWDSLVTGDPVKIGNVLKNLNS